MHPFRRLFDIALALVLMVLLAPLMGAIAMSILIANGAPVFHCSRRMKDLDKSFLLLKFRTMRVANSVDRPLGGDQSDRVTRLGCFLRDRRLDELPQLFNILKGDIGFVGPRAPLPRYVERFPELYRQVLRAKPGVTGLASLVFCGREEALLAGCTEPAETDARYTEICVPSKAELDLAYEQTRSFWSDLVLIVRTALVPVRGGKAVSAEPPAIGRHHEKGFILSAIGPADR